MANDGWISRKRKRPTQSIATNATATPPTTLTSSMTAVAKNDDDAPSSSSSSAIPASLMPHLGWTKLSACHRPRAKKRRRDNWNRDEPLRKVVGRAVFFIHDPNPGGGTSLKDESKIWFQGRFFPSTAAATGAARNASPTSVIASTNVRTNAQRTSKDSWGLLAVQNEIIDECLTCSEGGYRELDLTFIRQFTSNRNFMFSSSRKEKKARWTANDLVWTGGNMMTLSTDPYNASSSLSNDEPGANFEPQTLLEGHRAMEVASKYFPSMVKRLRIHHVTNNNEGEEDASKEAMVLIGDMEVVAPASFVNMRTNHRPGSFGNGDSSDDDGLWNDD